MAAIVWLMLRDSRSVAELVRDGRRAHALQKNSIALDAARRAVSRDDHSVEAWMLLAEASEPAEDIRAAAAAWMRVRDLSPSAAATAWMHLGRLQMKELHLGEAELSLQAALARDRSLAGAWRLRAQIAGVLGKSQQLFECLLELIRLREYTTSDLIVLGSANPFVDDPERIREISESPTDSDLALLAKARVALNAGRNTEAEQLLTSYATRFPHEWEAQALLGQQLAERSKEAFLAWQRQLPAAADDSSRIWLTRAAWLRAQGELQPASRCYWEAVRREPELLPAVLQLGQTLSSLGERSPAELYNRYAKRLQRIADLTKRVQEEQGARWADELITELESAGRFWEAWAWCRELKQDPRIARRTAQLEARLTPDLPRTVPGFIPGQQLDWSLVPLPDWRRYGSSPAPPTAIIGDVPIRFKDDGARLGLHVEYSNSDDPTTAGRRIFETMGGGVAALDYDGDGWVDLYFPQGGNWPVDRQSGPNDSLYRNLGGSQFVDVTAHSGIVDREFGQGVSAGDFDNDGFQDLYVANIGRNQLFRSNGDGTFADATAAAGISEEAWTSSCAIADLNGDGFPDLFDVNYLEGKELFRTICVDDQGEPRVCRPTVFEPATDALLVNRGDGSFVDRTQAAGLDLPHGMGLGVVVADFDGDRRLDVFIANDQTPNYLLMNAAVDPGQPLSFSEQGMLRGAALDRDGFAQACMGVASGDVNGDGAVDLLVTNFAEEGSTLYLSQPGGAFADATREAELRAPSFSMLGFGAQFLDADHDGLLDLVVLNGHIDDFSKNGVEYRMRPQLFRGLPGAKFAELFAEQAGEFFGIKRLGRGLATLDWNRDGKLDLVGSYLEGPAALITNQTAAASGSVRLRLVGTISSRDAIGAVVRVRFPDGTTQQVQLTAGNGYESCNERLIHVGLGAHERASQVEIAWPSGKTSRYEDVLPGSVWLAIEESPQLTAIDGSL